MDPEVVVDRALRFPGDREREICLAFGELMSYLEFELANPGHLESVIRRIKNIDSVYDAYRMVPGANAPVA